MLEMTEHAGYRFLGLHHGTTASLNELLGYEGCRMGEITLQNLLVTEVDSHPADLWGWV
jgi:hypothetical protein